jgi:hypothetical protein
VYKEQINDSPTGRKIVINLKLHSVAVKGFSKQTSEQFIVSNENARMEKHFIATAVSLLSGQRFYYNLSDFTIDGEFHRNQGVH